MPTSYLAILPLRHIVFPGEKLNLHIFEPRYKQLVTDCSQGNAIFGIPPSINSEISEYGTEIKILSIEKVYPGGEMDIRTEGMRIFRILSLDKKVENKLYSGALVEFVEQVYDFDEALQTAILTEIKTMYEQLNIDKAIGDFRTFDIGHHIGFSHEQEYHFLQLHSERNRQLFVLEHLRRILPIIVETERLKQKIKLNGYFQKFNPLEWK